MALLLKKMKDYQSALKYALRCVRLDPEGVSHLILLADLYVLLGDDEMALDQYNKALNLDPKNQRIRLLLTTILIRKEQFDIALGHLEVLTEQSPELVIAYYYRGRINLETGSYQEAEEAFQEALRLNESLEPALFDLSTLYQITERYSDAIETYEKLLGFYPDNLEARKRLVDLYLKLGDEEKAELHTEKIREHSKPGEPGRQALGLIYLKQGKLDESIEELELIVSAWPDDQKSRYYLGTAYEEKEDLDKALEHFRQVKPDSKYFISAQMHIAYMLERQKKYDEAISVLERAIELKREKAELYLMLASVYEGKEEYQKGIQVIREGLKHHEDNIDLAFRLGVLLDKSGDKESCLDQMRGILEIDPNHADSLNYIGYTYADQGIRLDEAMEMIQRALMIKPDSGYIIDSLGWVYYQKGLYDEALSHLQRAAELTAGDPTINEHLGDAYFKKKQLRESLAYYKKALSLNHPDEKRLKQKIIEVERLLEIEN
jgi:tetratricopeptide (TPR) repeat protein